MSNDFPTPLFTAGMDMLKRMGARAVRIGFSPEEDGPPVVWHVAVQTANGGEEAAGALDPTTALVRLLEATMDGGTCAHCKRPTAVSADPVATALEAASEATFCWYRFDPELVTFRRGCEGMAP